MWGIVIVAGLVALLLILLYVPLEMVLNTDVYGKPKFRLRFSWLFGLVSREIIPRKAKPAEKEKAVKARKRPGWRNARIIFRIIRTRGVLKKLIELLKDVFSCFKFRDMVADFKVGLGDPADTGLLFAIIGPATAFLGSSPLHRIRFEPSFTDDAVLQGYSHGTVRLRPIRLVPPFLKFIFSLTALRIAWTLISSKWRRKN